jgi:hypothetical protein
LGRNHLDEVAEEALDLEGGYEMKDFWCLFWKNLKYALRGYFVFGVFIGLVALVLFVCNVLMAKIGAFFTIVALIVFVTITATLVGTALDMYWDKKGYR